MVTSATKCNRGIYMFLWMLVAPQALKSVLPVADSFSNNEMRTFSHIRTHQPASETINTSLWWRKPKPASVNYFGVEVLAPKKVCGTFPWRVPVFSVLWNIMFSKKNFSFFKQYSCISSATLDDQWSGTPGFGPLAILSFERLTFEVEEVIEANWLP